MNWDRIEGNWKQFAGEAKKRWGKLTESDLHRIEGKKDELVGRIQARYGTDKERARREIETWADALEPREPPRQ